jgi:hypothetical protein
MVMSFSLHGVCSGRKNAESYICFLRVPENVEIMFSNITNLYL